MTSEGTPAGVLNGRFEHALRSRDLKMAIAAARDFPVVISLDRAARLLHLMAHEQSPSFPRAAARWMQRYAGERSPTVEQLAAAADALAEMDAGNPSAAETLILLCGGRTDR